MDKPCNSVGQKSCSWFSTFARGTARAAGKPAAFIAAAAIVVAWLVSGPIFGFSDTWQLVINTGTTIITFLMVFVIQNSQNRDSEAVQIKLDELIRAIQGAENELIDLEEMDEQEIEKLHRRYRQLAEQSRHELTERTKERSAKGGNDPHGSGRQ